DIVPNHMAASSDNPYWMDVLESGSASPFAPWFDIDWNHPKEALKNKVLLPVLGAPFGRVVENGDLVLAIDDHGFLVNYHENKLPVSIESYRLILSYQLDSLESMLGSGDGAVREIREIIHDVGCLSSASKPEAAPVDHELSDEQIAAAATAKERLLRLYKNSADAKRFIDANLIAFNGKPGDPGSFSLLEKLLDQQHYRLSFWRLANEEINYRRFFTISDLVGIRVEDPGIFTETHALFKQWVAGGVATGIRVDHIDGLRDPADYLRRLQKYLASARVPGSADKPALKPLYIVVEKILAEGESLRPDWPVSGTTGYDFLNTLNGVFIKPEGVLELTKIYDRFIGSEVSFEDIVHKKKILVMETLLGGEMRSLGSMLGRLAEKDRYARDLP
ncbi:MAG: malto-oligosyltrehalose synthase, partial [Candidatus Dormibacteraceae bacterium]